MVKFFKSLSIKLIVWLAILIPAAILAQIDFTKQVKNVSLLNGHVLVDGVTYPFTNAGIQAAVNAVPDGGEVDLGPGTYLLTGSGTEEILITKRLNFVCSGWGTILQVGASVPATTDIFHLKPSALVQGMRIQDCYITPASGTPGRHGINIDGTNQPLSNLVIEHVRIDALGGKSIAVTNATGLPTGTPFTTTISNSYMAGAVDFTNGGDSLNLLGNTMTGSGGLTVFLTGATVQTTTAGGAHGFVFRGNNFTNTGGIILNNAWQGEIVDNDIEVANLAEANAACIDLDGNSNANVENVKVSGNFLACANGVSSVDQIRINRMNAAVIEKNFISRSVGVTYRILAAADRTQIFFDRHSPSGEQITTWLSNAGTNTVVKWIDEVTGLEASTSSMAWGPANSTTRNFAISGVQLRAGNNSALGFSSGDPTGTGLDTGLSRLSAGNIAAGNGTVGDTSGTIKSSGFLANCNTSQRTETAADANVLTCPIPAQVGSYRIRFILSVSAANAATLGWTVAWIDSNGTVQAPANLDLFQIGTVTPAFTYTTSVAGDYYGYADIDVNNAGTSIVVKLGFSGTSFTGKVSATVERII